jgi:hypothetical protein
MRTRITVESLALLLAALLQALVQSLLLLSLALRRHLLGFAYHDLALDSALSLKLALLHNDALILLPHLLQYLYLVFAEEHHRCAAFGYGFHALLAIILQKLTLQLLLRAQPCTCVCACSQMGSVARLQRADLLGTPARLSDALACLLLLNNQSVYTILRGKGRKRSRGVRSSALCATGSWSYRSHGLMGVTARCSQ